MIKLSLCYCIVYYYNIAQIQAVLTGRSTVSGFDLALFSSIFQAPLHLQSSWCYIGIKIFLLISLSLPFNELSLVGLAVDLLDY